MTFCGYLVPGHYGVIAVKPVYDDGGQGVMFTGQLYIQWATRQLAEHSVAIYRGHTVGSCRIRAELSNRGNLCPEANMDDMHYGGIEGNG